MSDTIAPLDNSPSLDTSPAAPRSPLDDHEAPTGSDGALEAAAVEPEQSPEETRISRAIAQAAKRERRARQIEREARARSEQLEREKGELSARHTELEDLFKEVNRNPEKAKKLLDRAGLDLDTLAQVLLGIDKPKPTIEDEVTELKRQLKEREDKELKLKQAQEEQQYQQYIEQVKKRDTDKVKEVLGKSPDTFELIEATDSHEEVLYRAYKFIESENIPSLTDEQQSQLVEHFANEIEQELYDKHSQELTKLSKLKKLQAIQSHNSNKTSSDQLETTSVATKKPQFSSKFITNENTVRPAVINEIRSKTSRDDDLIAEAVRFLK
jgi:hypothetical protein